SVVASFHALATAAATVIRTPAASRTARAVTARPVSASSRAAASARSSGVCCSTMKISHFHNLVTFVSRFHVTTSGKKKQHHRKNYGAQGATPHHPRD